ncbi:MAG: hypothetical protein ACK5NN_15695 [Sphingomonadaceae bacterium]
MQGIGSAGEDCPFSFNFDASTFKVGDTVSYRVTGMDDFPFVGELLEVHDDHVIIAAEQGNPAVQYRATREDRPVVDGAQI